MNTQTKHKHGGNPLGDFERMGLPHREIIDFSVNLNPMGVPSVIMENWNNLLAEAQNYPDIEGSGIARFYSHKMGISPENLLAGNGSTELIYLIPRALGLRRALIVSPSFNDYERASLLAGAEVKRIQLIPDNNFILPGVDEIEDAIRDADSVWLGRPNNPTTNLFPKEIIEGLVAGYPEKTFIVDEAFIQFSDNWKNETLINGKPYPNLLILHSMTKFYAVAGLRMGGVIGHRDNIARLRNAKEPWTINGIADRAAMLLEQCEEYESATISYIKRERARIYRRLKEVQGISVFPSDTNFFLCRWERTNNLDDLFRHLLMNGFYVRDCRNFTGLEDNFFRFGIRTENENDLLISHIGSCTI